MGKSASLAAFTMTDTSASEVGLTEKFWSKLHAWQIQSHNFLDCNGQVFV